MTDELTKICTTCGRELPLSEFGKNKPMKDGLDYKCKECKKEYNKLRYEQNTDVILNIGRKYKICVAKPSCPRVGGRGGQFEIFICEICGTEFRRNKSVIDWNYEHLGCLPRFCSRKCMAESQRKSHTSEYAKEIERIKREVG